MKVLKIGILDDDRSKVTQIMNCLIKGVEGANKEKIENIKNLNLNQLKLKLKIIYLI